MDSSRKNNLSTMFWIPEGRVLQGNNLGYKERRQNSTTIKAPMPPRIKVRIIDPSLALQSCENISNLIFGGYLAGSTPVPSARYSSKILPMLCPILIGPLFYHGFHTKDGLDFLLAHGHRPVRPTRLGLSGLVFYVYPLQKILDLKH